MKKGFVIKDLHCHMMEPYSLCALREYQCPALENAAEIGNILKECGLEALNIPAITLYDEPDLACNALSLYAKLLYPGKVYALAGIRRYREPERNADMAGQAGELMKMGFDGFKMICKPNARRVLPLRIDDGIFDAFFGEAEKEKWPILFHVGDPETFWDEKKVPAWARENGWYYGGEQDKTAGMPSYRQLYEEVEHVLEKHPTLHITFAHFFFLSNQMEYAARLFRRFPFVCFDLTPGTEMYLDFSARPAESRAFFSEFRERLLFGTDNVAVNGEKTTLNREVCREKCNMIKTFLETENEMEIDGKKVKGLGLEDDILERIYAGNFDRFFAGRKPAPVEADRAAALASEYLSDMKGEDIYSVRTKETLHELIRIFGAYAAGKS